MMKLQFSVVLSFDTSRHWVAAVWHLPTRCPGPCCPFCRCCSLQKNKDSITQISRNPWLLSRNTKMRFHLSWTASQIPELGTVPGTPQPAEFHMEILMSIKGVCAALSRDDTKWPAKRSAWNSFEGSREVTDPAKGCEVYVQFHIKLQTLLNKTNRLVQKKK